jgi:hypothetical protein
MSLKLKKYPGVEDMAILFPNLLLSIVLGLIGLLITLK